MPNNGYLRLFINNYEAEISSADQLAITLNYTLEEPENFGHISGDQAINLTLPATTRNDQIFNTYYNPSVEDLTPNQQYRTWTPARFEANGVPILFGYIRIISASAKEKPEAYHLEFQGGNSQWIIDGQNLTLWDCLNTTSHNFDVATIEQSWQNAGGGGYDSDENHDFVYAPVRYRQPFQYTNSEGGQVGADNTVSIYMLRPSISIYWMIIRGFRQLGLSVNSQFLNTAYFRRLVMPWTWGDFYDITGSLVDGIAFKGAGLLPITEPPPSTGAAGVEMWTGNTSGSTVGSAGGSSWWGFRINPGGMIGSLILPTGGQYIFSGALAGTNHFNISDDTPPNGFNNFALYSFDDTTGTMIWDYNPPPLASAYYGNNVTVKFRLNLHLYMNGTVGVNALTAIEVVHIFASGAPTVTTNANILNGGATVVGTSNDYPDNSGYPTTQTIYDFQVPNVSVGDQLRFRLRAITDGGGLGCTFFVAQAGYINVNPAATGASPWQYDFSSNQWAKVDGSRTDNIWQQTFSTIQLTGIQLQLGGPVNFQWYDAFRNYRFSDMLNGLVDMFNLQIKSDPLAQSVTIEPRDGTFIPDYDINGNYTSDIRLTGFIDTSKVYDWTNKLDLTKGVEVENFAHTERQLDFMLKPDGADGGAAIYTARYKGLNPNNITKYKLQNLNVENGLIAAVPAASRYMLPDIYAKGNKQQSNRFFSPCMHYKVSQWKALGGNTMWPAPQLLSIFPVNINDSSASAVTQVFEPKIAFYKGLQDPAGFGGWNWIGDPNGLGVDVPTYAPPVSYNFHMPYLFSVNYNSYAGLIVGAGDTDPVLSYSDQLVYDTSGTPTIASGLMRRFFLKKLAIMRNGQIVNANMRLNLYDVTNWLHREAIRIDQNLYYIIGISGYKPLSDESCEVKLWKVVYPEQVDLDNSYPSATSILTNPLILSSFDLKYAQLLLLATDIPQAY